MEVGTSLEVKAAVGKIQLMGTTAVIQLWKPAAIFILTEVFFLFILDVHFLWLQFVFTKNYSSPKVFLTKIHIFFCLQWLLLGAVH